MNKNILKQIFILVVLIELVLPQGVFAQDSGWGGTVIDSGWGNTTVDSGWGSTVIDNSNSGWGNTTVDSGWGNTVVNNSNSGWGNTTIDSGSGWGNTVVNQVSPVIYSQTYTPTTYGFSNGYGYSSYGYAPVYGYTNYSAPGSPTFINNTTTQCPSGSSLSNGTCIINNTQCPAGTSLVNGVCTVTTTQCPAGTTLVSGVCTINATSTCPTGSSLINGVCTVTTTNCPTGSVLINGVCTVNTTYCPTGSSLVNGVCTVNSVNYGYTNYTYPSVNYGYTNYNYNNYQTCWDGSVIPSTQACAAQYKTCSSGSVVLISQTCYKTCLNGSTIPDYQSCPYSYNTNVTQVVYPTVVKFNNTVTSPATQVTNNSARCNGIGLIANGVASTGWFEYGETANLGRDTAHTAIGTNPTAPFSNVLANLKPSTKYYCRAVMNNQYGTFKGTIVSFTTRSTAVSYVAPKQVAKPAPVAKKTVVKQTKAKNEVICTNWETVSVNNESQSTLLKAGQKLITVQLDKVSGNIYPDSEVNYKLNFKNVSSSRLNDVLVKVVLPEDFAFVSTNVGTYDEESRTLTFVQSSIDAYQEGIVSFKIKVNNNAPLGKSVVTTGYVSYTILSSSNTPVSDEVTTYSVSSIAPNLTTNNLDTGAKKVIGTSSTSTKTFLPSSLIEWLALISIMFILFILGRSIYATYQDEEEKSH